MEYSRLPPPMAAPPEPEFATTSPPEIVIVWPRAPHPAPMPEAPLPPVAVTLPPEISTMPPVCWLPPPMPAPC